MFMVEGRVRRVKEKEAQQEFSCERSRWKGMVLLLCFLVGGFFVSVCVASEQGNFRFGPRDKAYGIHFIDDSRGWIVGDMGLAAMTTDGGESWSRVAISGGG